MKWPVRICDEEHVRHESSTYKECLRDIGLAVKHCSCSLEHFSDYSMLICSRILEMTYEAHRGVLSFHINHILVKA